MTIDVNNVTVIDSNRVLRLSSGDTRPSSPVKGMFWFNTLFQQLEIWDGSSWRAQKSTDSAGGSLVWGWGSNNRGRLGTGDTIEKSSPVSAIGGISDWTSISNLGNHVLALRPNGTAWSWGYNAFGQLGDGTTTNRSSPVSVIGGFTDWTQISAGLNSSTGIRANGTAWAWGNNFDGQLGDGTSGTVNNKSSPTPVIGGFSDWIHISPGWSHTAAIRANGTTWTWGKNNFGQLGDGSTTNRSSPGSVLGGYTDWTQLSLNKDRSFGLRANGTIWAWGDNTLSRLGSTNTSASVLSPSVLRGGVTNWIKVSGGAYHGLGLKTDGTLWSWGSNYNGQLGTIFAQSAEPTIVRGGFTDWMDISAGKAHSMGIRLNGTLWSWGNNFNGQLGTSNTTSRSSPGSVVGGFTNWIKVAAGNYQTLAIKGTQ